MGVNRWLSLIGFNNLVFNSGLVNNFFRDIEEPKMKKYFPAVTALLMLISAGSAKAQDVIIDHIIWGGADL